MDSTRIGKISSVNAKDGKCRVVYSDRDNCTTVELPLVVYNDEYAMPRVGDMVLVQHQPNGSASAFIVGRYWSKEHQTPEHTGEGYRRKDFDRDGKCYWEYAGDDDGGIKVHNDDKVDLETDAELTIKGASSAELSSDGTITIKGGSIVIEGGNVTITGNTVIDGIQFSTHVHNCTAPGTPSGPPI